MNAYVTIEIPQQGQLLPMVVDVVPTGAVEDDKAEGICITPRVNLTRVWFTKEQLVSKTSK